MTNLQIMRERKKMTQTELASKSGLTQQAISKIENEETADPAGSTLYKLAKALCCAMEELISEDNPSHDRTA